MMEPPKQTKCERTSIGRHLYVSVERRAESVDEIKIANLPDKNRNV